MGKLDKQLKKLSPEEQVEVERLTERIVARDLRGVDCKKLKGLKNLFRVRKGRIRIIFELRDGKEPTIFSIERRKEDTYKF